MDGRMDGWMDGERQGMDGAGTGWSAAFLDRPWSDEKAAVVGLAPHTHRSNNGRTFLSHRGWPAAVRGVFV